MDNSMMADCYLRLAHSEKALKEENYLLLEEIAYIKECVDDIYLCFQMDADKTGLMKIGRLKEYMNNFDIQEYNGQEDQDSKKECRQVNGQTSCCRQKE